MSRKIFKNKETVSSSPFMFQNTLSDEMMESMNPLDAEAELDAFQHEAPPKPKTGGGAKIDVESIIQQAQNDADAIIAQAQSRAAEIEREAYEKGLEEGRKTGEIMADQQLQAVLNLYHNSLDKLDRMRELLLNQLQMDVIDLVIHASEKVVKTELQTNARAILHMVRSAIQSLKERKNLTIFLNQEDHQYLMGLSESEKQTWLGTQVQLEIDPNLLRGSFRIETNAGELDALIETQLKQISEALSQVEI